MTKFTSSVGEGGSVVGFLNPEKLFPLFSVGEGMKISDFGCGTGYFSVLAAKRVGPNGKVYAIDVQESSLEAVRSRARLENLFNLQTVRANLEVPGSTRVADLSQDMVFIHNVLFQSAKKENIIQEAYRILKTGGRLIVIEWLPNKYPSDPSVVQLISPQDMKNMVVGQGFVSEKDFSAGVYHYGLIFKK